MNEAIFKDKLSKLQAMHIGALTEGEKQSAIKAKARILKKIKTSEICNNLEYKFSLKSRKNVDIFIDLLNKYEINEYRTPKVQDNIIIAKVPSLFIDNILWPEYLATPNRLTV